MHFLSNCLRFRRTWRRTWKFVIVGYILLTFAMFLVWFSYGAAWVPNLTGDAHKFHQKSAHIHSHIATSHQPPMTKPAACHLSSYNYFLKSQLALDHPTLCDWVEHTSVTAERRFTVYGSEFAVLHDAVVDPSAVKGRKGGEDINEVLNQAEEAEYMRTQPGYFSLSCKPKSLKPQSFRVSFGKNYLNNWAQSVTCRPGNSSQVKERVVEGLTIALQRFEYVNLYHTMCDFFNAFLMVVIFNPDPKHTTVLWVDGHPKGGLDETWETLFGRAQRAGWLEGPTRFQHLVWSPLGYHSPLNFHEQPQVPYLEHFREFFLGRFDVPREKPLECSNLQVLLVVRRDYVAHPRNPKGLVKRKIHNEKELLSCLRKTFPTDTFTATQLDLWSFREQLRAVTKADVMIGMHGAGLSHALFMPRHGGLIELYPNYWPQANRHFRAMAHWRRLHYDSWQNQDPHLEKSDFSTVIPPKVLLSMFGAMKKKMCPFLGQ